MMTCRLLLIAAMLGGCSWLASFARGAGTNEPNRPLMWSSHAEVEQPDVYVAFRGQWDLPSDADVEVRLLGASWFAAWLDGEFVAEGPARYPAEFPQYQTYGFHLVAGRHTLAIQVHHMGLATRMLSNLQPFLYCVVLAQGKELPVGWRCSRLGGYASQVRRINPELGFIEWCDTRQNPDWRRPDFDDSSWPQPARVTRKLGWFRPLSIANPRSLISTPNLVASGSLVEVFGYERDNPAARFFLRDLSPAKEPPQGVWRRYDLGRVRLMRPRFVLDVPAGAVVEFAYCEALRSGRVCPWITLSAGDSCNLDHYVARGGRQEFFPITPKGGRFLEVHVLAPPDQIHFLREEVLERCYYGPAEGDFTTSDPQLNRIWSVGVETLRACAEDACIDNPTRERGQWAGDVLTVGADIAAAVFSDLRLCRRGLVQCAQCARSDGLVAGLCPGGCEYLSSYAAQWISGAVHLWEMSGDRRLLEEMLPYAERNIAAFEHHRTPQGIDDSLGWSFVDWGYVRNPGPSDMGLNLHYLAALRDMVRWCEALGKHDRAGYYRGLAEGMQGVVRRYFDAELARGGEVWPRIGYHRAVLGLRLGFFRAEQERACVAFLKAHILRCFPNDPSAPRLSDPAANNPRLITPYFGHYALPLLIERGEMDFVLDQYRKCWGWALEDGRSTWLEVFDTRWSHCHQWAGCPTWQMSRYLLGLRPRYDLGDRHFVFSLVPGSLSGAQGRVPLLNRGGSIRVEWSRTADGLKYRLETPIPIHLHFPVKDARGKVPVVSIEHIFAETFRGL